MTRHGGGPGTSRALAGWLVPSSIVAHYRRGNAFSPEKAIRAGMAGDMTHQVRKNPFLGRDAASVKYDILAALNAAAFADSNIPKDLAHRLTTAIVARLNWARNELSIGHAQFADMWSCDLRRVKRILADLKGRGLLVVKHPGVRGRVTVYSLCIDAIVELTRPYWRRLGADFESRLSQLFPTDVEVSHPQDVQATDVGAAQSDVARDPGDCDATVRGRYEDDGTCPSQGEGPVHLIKKRLQRDVGRAAFSRWLQPLQLRHEGRRLIVVAHSSFVACYVERTFGDRIVGLARGLLPDIEDVRFQS